VGKICDFLLKSPFTSETVRDRPVPWYFYDYMTGHKHCHKTAWECIVLAYTVIAWGSCVRDARTVASPCRWQRWDTTYRPTSALLLRSQAYSIFSIFSLSISFHRLLHHRRTHVMHRRSDPRWAAARLLSPRCSKPGIKAIPRDVILPLLHPLTACNNFPHRSELHTPTEQYD